MTISSSNIKGLPDFNNNYPIRKKVIQVGDNPRAMLVVLHEAVVEELGINEDSWVDHIPTSQGLLKICRCSEFLASPKTGEGN